MKKILALLLVAAMCVSLVACSGGDKQTNDNHENIGKNTEQNEEIQNDIEPEYEIVEISLDNWQNYFELCRYDEYVENGFGEFENAYPYFYLASKEGIVLDIEKCDITIEYTKTLDYRPVTVDVENKTVTYGEPIESTAKVSEPEIKSMGLLYFGSPDNDIRRYGVELGNGLIDETQMDRGIYISSVDVLRISGSICIMQE